MAPHRMILHYDTVSPWAYVAHEVVKRYKKQWNMEVVRPSLLFHPHKLAEPF
jgi:2-hydroxychromene-2-carboxylate isomerase